MISDSKQHHLHHISGEGHGSNKKNRGKTGVGYSEMANEPTDSNINTSKNNSSEDYWGRTDIWISGAIYQCYQIVIFNQNLPKLKYHFIFVLIYIAK